MTLIGQGQPFLRYLTIRTWLQYLGGQLKVVNSEQRRIVIRQ